MTHRRIVSLRPSALLCCVLSIWVFVQAAAYADDWPQWLGPERDGVWRESGIVRTFGTDGLEVRWRRGISSGYAGPAVAAGRVYVADRVGELIIAKLSPAGYEEISRAHILEPTGRAEGKPLVWSHQAFANKCIYARNDKEIVCISLADR